MIYNSWLFLALLHSAKAGKFDSDYFERAKGEYFQGTIITTCEDVMIEFGLETAERAEEEGTCCPDDFGRRVLRGGDEITASALLVSRLWDGKVDDKTVINYAFVDNDFDEDTKAVVREQANKISEKSGVLVFKENANEVEGYALIHNSNGCASMVGKSKFQPQRIFLGEDCTEPKDIQRLFLHTAGMYYEQSRTDRDDYIQVLEQNIIEGKESNFAKRLDSESLGSRYDYGSIMHYGNFDFSKNSFPTIVAKGYEIGVTEELSTSDITQLRLMYQCKTGPRDFGTFLNDICSRNCPCWEGQRGCVFDAECQGGLVCDSRTCEAPPPPPTFPPQARPTARPKPPTFPPQAKPTPRPKPLTEAPVHASSSKSSKRTKRSKGKGV